MHVTVRGESASPQFRQLITLDSHDQHVKALSWLVNMGAVRDCHIEQWGQGICGSDEGCSSSSLICGLRLVICGWCMERLVKSRTLTH